jgi:hypothetical protein
MAIHLAGAGSPGGGVLAADLDDAEEVGSGQGVGDGTGSWLAPHGTSAADYLVVLMSELESSRSSCGSTGPGRIVGRGRPSCGLTLVTSLRVV